MALNTNRSIVEKTTCKHGENSSFPLFIYFDLVLFLFFFIKTPIRDFLLDIVTTYTSFV